MGLPWVRIGEAKGIVTRVCFAYVAGYFIRLTLFHFIALPMTILGMHFSTMSNVFTVALVVACGLSVWFGREVLRVKKHKKLNLTVYEKIYSVFCIGLIVFQLYMCIVMDPTYMTYDDAAYTVYSSDALATDYMFITNTQTGLFEPLGYRVIQNSLLFPAFITRLTGMPITVVERTFGYALNLLLAYSCYIYMAEDLYQSRENRLIFVIIISVIYIFGYHSHYSMTFRLLGPNSQGKAILAVTGVPMITVLLRKSMNSAYNWRIGCLLLLLSIAACALSLMGIIYMIILIPSLLLLSLFNKKWQWKKTIYIAWGCSIPCIYGIVYYIYK